MPRPTRPFTRDRHCSLKKAVHLRRQLLKRTHGTEYAALAEPETEKPRKAPKKFTIDDYEIAGDTTKRRLLKELIEQAGVSRKI